MSESPNAALIGVTCGSESSGNRFGNTVAQFMLATTYDLAIERAGREWRRGPVERTIHRFWCTLDDRQQHSGRPARAYAALLPVLKGSHREAVLVRKRRLGHAQPLAEPGDVHCLRHAVCGAARFGARDGLERGAIHDVGAGYFQARNFMGSLIKPDSVPCLEYRRDLNLCAERTGIATQR
jgi:hypothetical protein